MCFCRRRQNEEHTRQEAGKCRPMEIDEGPPPFCCADDDSYVMNPPDYDEIEELPNPSHLPLPPEARNRSLSPIKNVESASESRFDAALEISKMSTSAIRENVKGDTTSSASPLDSFSDIQSSSKESPEIQAGNEDDSEWGDFGEASAAPAPIRKNTSLTLLNKNSLHDDDDDEWGAFDQARPSTDRSESVSDDNNLARSQEARQLAHQQSLEDWGGFEKTVQTSSEGGFQEEDMDGDWQAEFTSASVAPSVMPPATSENLKVLENMLEDNNFWDDGFQEEYQQKENSIDVYDIPALLNAEALSDMSNHFESEKQRYSRLWLSLRVIEEAISLKFDWNYSEIRMKHFKSLHINPIIAKKENRPVNFFFDTSNLLLPTPVQTASPSLEYHDYQKTPSPSAPSNDSPSIPAVDFDWDTSGLTNPMNRASQSSAIIDVDFLGTNGVATAYTSPLQKDLELFGLANGENGAKIIPSSNGSSILDTLMRHTNGTSTSTNRYRAPEVLSLDARKLLEKLPDLQYLQSEVLMFPIGTNLPH